MKSESKNVQKVRRVLGRGLTNLIPVEEAEERNGTDVEMIDVNAVAPNPFQPRTHFSQDEIDELAESIRLQGLLQPLVVRKKVDGYELVSGERRFRAMRQLGWDKIPCLVKPRVTDREMMELALVENIQRENLNDIELAYAYQKLMTECGISHEELSKRVSKSRSMVSNTIRLLKLPVNLQDLIKVGKISAGHARALLSVESAEKQKVLAERILAEGLNVREVEEEAQKDKKGSEKNILEPLDRKKDLIEKDPDIANVVEQLEYRFGSSVKINRTSTDAGKIEIRFHSNDDMTRILDLLLAK